MENKEGKLSYAMSVGVYHDPSFGHRVEMWYGPTSRPPKVKQLGSWKGLGIPEPVLTDITSLLHATIVEHLVTRYGVAGELPMTWGGEPDPF